MSRKLSPAVLSIILIATVVAISITVAAWLSALMIHEEPKVFVELHMMMVNDSDPHVIFEANATWWVNTTKVQSQSQKWGWSLIGRSGPNVPSNASHVYLPFESTDGKEFEDRVWQLYCVPQLPENSSLNYAATLRMNPRVDLVFKSDVDWDGKDDSVMRVWCRPDSFPFVASGYPMVYVTAWVGVSS